MSRESRSAPLRAITKSERASYEADGVVWLPGVVDLGWVESLRAAVDEAMADPGPLAESYGGAEGGFFGDLDLWRRHAGFRACGRDLCACASRMRGAA